MQEESFSPLATLLRGQEREQGLGAGTAPTGVSWHPLNTGLLFPPPHTSRAGFLNTCDVWERQSVVGSFFLLSETKPLFPVRSPWGPRSTWSTIILTNEGLQVGVGGCDWQLGVRAASSGLLVGSRVLPSLAFRFLV